MKKYTHNLGNDIIRTCEWKHFPRSAAVISSIICGIAGIGLTALLTGHSPLDSSSRIFPVFFLINGLSAALMALETEKLWHRMVKGRIEKKLKKELSGIVPEDELEFVIRKIQIDEVIQDIREKVKKNVERKLRHEVEAAMFQQFLETVPEKMERNKRNTVEELEDLKKDIVATRRRSRKLK